MLTVTFQIFKIIDFMFIENIERYIMRAFLNTVCRRSDIIRNSFISVPQLSMDSRSEEILRKSGFIKEFWLTDKITRRKPLPFIIKPATDKDDAWNIDGVSILDFGIWHLTGIDVDNA